MTDKLRLTITSIYELPEPESRLESYGTTDLSACAALDAQADPEILIGSCDGDLTVTVVPVTGETPGQQLYSAWQKAFESQPRTLPRMSWGDMTAQAHATWEAVAPLGFSEEQSLQACKLQLELIADRLESLGHRRMARQIRDTLDLPIA